MEETAYLKNEVQRLTAVIDILINHIAILKRENDILKSEHGIKTVPNAMSEKMDGINSGETPIVKKMDGINSDETPILKNMDGINSGETPIVKKMDGINSGETPIVKNMDGISSGETLKSENKDCIKPVSSDISEMEERIKLAVYGMPETVTPPPAPETPVRKTAPKHIEVDDEAIDTLAMHLRKVFHVRTSDGKLRNVAKELLFLHNSGKGLGHDLRREARLSKPGFAKHLPTLHRHGLIQKGEKRFYHLTEFSKQLMDKLFGE
ncbi:MAG TPA: hypothetical protein VI757_06765 [Bacteroidia bacterium]|nr:hypothetical protein [Bacteroidia bacterium]